MDLFIFEMSSVPGMGQLDVDGLEAEQQRDLIDITSRLLSFATAATFLLAAVSLSVLLNKQAIYSQRDPMSVPAQLLEQRQREQREKQRAFVDES